MSGILSLLSNSNSAASSGSSAAGSNALGAAPVSQPTLLQSALKTGMSGSINSGFGGTGGNFFQNMLGNNAMGRTLGYGLDTMDKSGKLLNADRPQLPPLQEMSSPLAQLLSRRMSGRRY